MIRSYHPANLTVTVDAHATVKDIQAELAKSAQFIPIGPFAGEITIRQAIDHNLIGRYSETHGLLKNWLLNLELSLVTGKIITGADVMKNVSGYDLTHLMVGAGGAFGQITAATFKLMPLTDEAPADIPVRNGLRIVTLPSRVDALTHALQELSLTVKIYPSLGVVDVEDPPVGLKHPLEKLKSDYRFQSFPIRNWIPQVPPVEDSLVSRLIQVFAEQGEMEEK